jgi:hypothetical protein
MPSSVPCTHIPTRFRSSPLQHHLSIASAHQPSAWDGIVVGAFVPVPEIEAGSRSKKSSGPVPLGWVALASSTVRVCHQHRQHRRRRYLGFQTLRGRSPGARLPSGASWEFSYSYCTTQLTLLRVKLHSYLETASETHSLLAAAGSDVQRFYPVDAEARTRSARAGSRCWSSPNHLRFGSFGSFGLGPAPSHVPLNLPPGPFAQARHRDCLSHSGL